MVKVDLSHSYVSATGDATAHKDYSDKKNIIWRFLSAGTVLYPLDDLPHGCQPRATFDSKSKQLEIFELESLN